MDQSSDDDEEEMNEDESTSNVSSSDGEEDARVVMRARARAMIGPATAAEEDKDMKASEVPIRAVPATKRSKREEEEEEEETGGDSSGNRRQIKLKGAKGPRDHHGHGALQDSRKKKRRAKADDNGGALVVGCGCPLLDPHHLTPPSQIPFGYYHQRPLSSLHQEPITVLYLLL